MLVTIVLLFLHIWMVKAPPPALSNFSLNQHVRRIPRQQMAKTLTCAGLFPDDAIFHLALLKTGENNLRAIAHCTNFGGCYMKDYTNEQGDVRPVVSQTSPLEIVVPEMSSVQGYSCTNDTHVYLVIVEVPRHSPGNAAPSIDHDVQYPDIAPPSFDSQAQLTNSSENTVPGLPMASGDEEEESLNILHPMASPTSSPEAHSKTPTNNDTDPVKPYRAATITLSIFSGLSGTFIVVKAVINVIQNGIPKCDAELWCNIMRCIFKHRPKVSIRVETSMDDDKNKRKKEQISKTVEAEETSIDQIVEDLLEMV